MRGVAACMFVAVLILPQAATADDDIDPLCARLHAFYEAPFEKGAHFRSVEFHWLGLWMDFDKGWRKVCHFTQGDAAATALCSWLPENVSFEFPEYLPHRIVECEPGVHWPQSGDVTVDITYGKTTIFTSDRYVRLEIDFRDRKNADVGIQLTAFDISADSHHDEFTDKIPQLFGPDNPVTEP
ncbi:MAG TPA: hypothetical protein VHZ78_12390 [Rhizomicrobium sp.]|jgi:hypothetical protein|nr:hypothetical protein [Rhizomicrobium sp.]